ncbi:hypothetical protein GGI07_001413 [Coemansia sp. Benny D115]|nr:hypothetical protein GGI07_001413 [Coemansia sp. Benny D115]
MRAAVDADGFTLVTSKSSNNSNSKRAPCARIKQQPATNTSKGTESSNHVHQTAVLPGKRYNKQRQQKGPTIEETVEKILYKIADKRYTLQSSGYMKQMEKHQQLINRFDPQEVVCYGIGSPATSLVSQWQMALLMELGYTNIHAFDPVMSDVDQLVLEKLHIQIIPTNEEGARKAVKRTLFYMPHCEQFLYENLVCANWSRDLLPNVLVIGNGFASYLEAQGRGKFAQESAHLARAVDHLECLEFPSEKLLKLKNSPYAFTNTCLQTIKQSSLDGCLSDPEMPSKEQETKLPVASQ